METSEPLVYAETAANFMGRAGEEFESCLPAFVLYPDGTVVVGRYRSGRYRARRPPYLLYRTSLSAGERDELLHFLVDQHRFEDADEHYAWAMVTDYDTQVVTVKTAGGVKCVSVYAYADEFAPEDVPAWALHHFPPIYHALWQFRHPGMRRYNPPGYRFLAIAHLHGSAGPGAGGAIPKWPGDLPFAMQADQWHRFGEQVVHGARGRELANLVFSLPEGAPVDVGGERLPVYARAMLPHEL